MRALIDTCLPAPDIQCAHLMQRPTFPTSAGFASLRPRVSANDRPRKITFNSHTREDTTASARSARRRDHRACLAQKVGPVGSWGSKCLAFLHQALSQPEQVLYHRLIRALPDHIVLAQVQVSRVLGVKKGSNFHEWNNRINRLSYDFVVCGKDASVIAAIELDDKSHETATRGKTDAKKNKASADAGLRLVRWHVRALPDEDGIRNELFKSETMVAQPPAPQVKSRAGRSAASQETPSK
jgi:Protein of unknown function (DUF2726)